MSFVVAEPTLSRRARERTMRHEAETRRVRGILSGAAMVLVGALASGCGVITVATDFQPEPICEGNDARVGELAPSTAAEALEGGALSIDQHDGSVVLIAFWNGDCDRCRDELRRYVELLEQFEAEGLSLLLVSTDNERDQVATMAEVFGLRGRVGYMGTTALSAYQGSALPLSLLIDRSRTIRAVWQGFAPGCQPSLEDRIAELLLEAPDRVALTDLR